MTSKIICANCLEWLAGLPASEGGFDLTFLDPPFNQGKAYTHHDDAMDEREYWRMMQTICTHTHRHTRSGGAIYFMQREKNAEFVLRVLRESGWALQNLIIWKKKTSAVPVASKFGKHYQVIVYATKGARATTFHRLRVDPELPANYKHKRENGVYVTDVWDDIRELTSGYFAGDEALRHKNGERFHKQQSPLALLLRIILSSSQPGDLVFDPFAGTGTTLVVAKQLARRALGLEVAPENIRCIEKRLAKTRKADDLDAFYNDYRHTPDLEKLWGIATTATAPTRVGQRQRAML